MTQLGDRVLDLDAAVQLQEPEVVAVEHELGGACAAVADRAGEGDGGLAHSRAQRRIERGDGDSSSTFWWRRWIEHSRSPSDDGVSGRVREQLDLDVARPFDVALGEDPVVAEGRLGLAARGGERLVQLVALAHDPHPAAASARGRLDHERKADALRIALLDDRDADAPSDVLRRELVAAGAERLRGRADEDEPGGLDRLGEGRALGQEAVTGMDRAGARLPGGADVLLGLEVPGDLDRLVRASARAASRRRRARRRRPCRSRAAAGAEDPDGDLAAVGHEQLLDHGLAPVRRASLEERAQPLLALVARAPLGDAARGLQAVERRVEDEPLGVLAPPPARR